MFRTQINDVLLSSFVRALQRSIGGSAFRIDLEGHGREHLADDIDVSRTVGWFTTLFPVALEVSAGADATGALLAVRDQLRQVPHRGMSYGLLRHAAQDPAVRDSLTAAASSILFNYLGQFDAVVADSTLFTFANESTGPWRSPQARRTHALEIICIVREGQLEMQWHYDANLHHEATIVRLANDMVAILREVLAIAATTPAIPFTPADFPLAPLDPAALGRLLARYPQAQDIYPLTPMQRLFFAMEASQSNLGFEQWHFRVDGAIDAPLLRRAIEYVIARHSILRTAFLADGGAEPLQVVSRSAPLPWSEEDWRGMAATDQDARIAALLHANAKIGFELAQAPAMRIALRRITDTGWHFVWSTHHLCIDGWSWPLVFRDVSRAYAALEAGTEPALEATIPFREYVEWLGESAPRSEDFWKSQLKGFAAPTPLKLQPVPAASVNSTAGTTGDHASEVVVTIAADVTAALQALARGEQVTLSVVLNAAWSLLLSHYSAAPDVVFGAAFSGRPAEVHGIDAMVGPCVNNLPVRVTVVPEDTLSAWLGRLQQRQFDIAQHQYAPLEQIQQWANIPWRHRLFDSLVVFQNYQVDADAQRIGANARIALLAAPQATNYALTLVVTTEECLRIRLIYQPGAFESADVQQFAADLSIVLHAMAQPTTATLAAILCKLPQGMRGKASELASIKPLTRSGHYSAPTSDAERVIAAVWQELFGVERVSLDDNFFELGGQSLMLVRAHVQLRERLRPDLPIVALLQYPTVRALARHLTDGASTATTSNAAIDRAQKQREAQLRQRTLAKRR